MKRVLFTFLLAVMVVASQACATVGGYGIGLPGYEAAAVMAANAALPYQILAAGQVGQPFYGGAPYGYSNVPVCRAQDLVGLPPISVSQPVIVRMDKSKRHQAKDIFGGAAIGAGLGWFNGGSVKAVAVGAGAGAGGGLLVSNHEQELCLLLPVKAP